LTCETTSTLNAATRARHILSKAYLEAYATPESLLESIPVNTETVSALSAVLMGFWGFLLWMSGFEQVCSGRKLR
jgi:hypothetical protein